MTCTACGKVYEPDPDAPADSPHLCVQCAWPCYACGKPWSEHATELPTSGVRPRMPCLGLRSGYAPKPARSVYPPRPAAPTEECHCKQYRMALEAIVRGVGEGWQAATLGDVARIALLLGPGEERRRG